LIQFGESAKVIQPILKNDKVKITIENWATIIVKYASIIFPEITKILNIIFSHNNNDFKDFTVEFVKQNISIPDLKEIVIEIIIKHNGIEGVIPFFQKFFQTFEDSIFKIWMSYLVKLTKKG
jgi:hypothetical protein